MHRVVVLASLAACGRAEFDVRSDAASDPADAQLFARCGGALIFDDDFDTAGAGPIFVLNTGTNIPAAEIGGELTFDLTGTITAREYRTYRSALTYPLDGLCITVEITRLVTCSPCGTYVKIFDSAQAAELYAFPGAPFTLSMRTHINAVSGSGTIDHYVDIPLALPQDRFWQLRQVGTATYWETSSDGVAFVRHTQQLDLFTDAAVTIALGAGAASATSNGGIAGFQRITTYGP